MQNYLGEFQKKLLADMDGEYKTIRQLIGETEFALYNRTWKVLRTLTERGVLERHPDCAKWRRTG